MRGSNVLRQYWAVLAVALALAVGIWIGLAVAHVGRAGHELPLLSSSGPMASPSPQTLSASFAQVAAKVTPAVVNIDTESIVRLNDSQSGSRDNGLFNHFFHMGPGAVPSEIPQRSLGSGVILDKSGLVLTNYHVVMQDDRNHPVDSIRVHLQGDDNGGRGYRGRIVGYDKYTDLAVIKINAGRPLPVAGLGNSNDVRVGDWVLAIGSPFGLNETVTAGIISAKGREVDDSPEDEFKRFLQTDAEINPGNSGGPLVNLSGQVIGINTEIATSRGVYEGVGFAIPSEIVQKVYNDIVTTGSVRRGAIGVSFSTSQNQALLRSFGATHGVVVDSVEAGGPAARAGLRLGDVIVAVGRHQVDSGNELLNIVSNTPPGQRLRVVYLRTGKQQTCELTVAQWDKIVAADGAGSTPAERSPDGPSASTTEGLGIAVRNLSSGESKGIAAALHLAEPEGVRIESVDPGSFADELGLDRFDVILSLDHQTVRSVDDFDRVRSRLKPGHDVLFLVARRNGAGYSTLFLADPLP